MADPVCAPAKPWDRGQSEGRSVFRLVLDVLHEKSGQLWTEHGFFSQEDQQVAESLPNKGLLHVAHAFLVETVRREAFTCAILKMSKDNKFLASWAQADASQREIMEQELHKAVEGTITGTLPKLVPGSVKGVLEMLAAQSETRVKESKP